MHYIEKLCLKRKYCYNCQVANKNFTNYYLHSNSTIKCRYMIKRAVIRSGQDQELLSLLDRGDTKRYGLTVLQTDKKVTVGTGNARQKIVTRPSPESSPDMARFLN